VQEYFNGPRGRAAQRTAGDSPGSTPERFAKEPR
jgi:hypothetical protein